MVEVIERVAKLEERFDGVTAALSEVKAELKAEIKDLRSELRAEMRSGFNDLRVEFRSEAATLRAEMHTQFRWLMSGLGAVGLAVLVDVLSR